MRRNSNPTLTLLTLVAAFAALVTITACEAPTPEERVADLRSEYSAELNSFTVEETPLGDDVEDAEMAEEAAEEAMDEADVMADEEMVEEEVVEEVLTRQDVLLDIVVRKTGSTEQLPGLTLDVYQVDADQADKATFRIYVDTSRLNKGGRKAVTHVLEDVDYEEGDGFAVEVRHPVPPELYPEYQEFEEATEEG